MTRICLNIACGNAYVDEWLNYDYAPVSAAVTKANLLERLPISDGVADVVYSSHFLEHIPQKSVNAFLGECFRVLKPGGQIRLVLPDLEELCREYLNMREAKEHEKADFVILEMLDQCVRKVSGGKLAEYYRSISCSDKREMVDYITMRTGEQLTDYLSSGTDSNLYKPFNIMAKSARLRGKLEQLYCLLLTSLLPSAFIEQNINFTQIGECHAWIYDFYTLSKLLGQTGFAEIKKLNFDHSEIEAFPLYPLDITDRGYPRKGRESMYVEAKKP